MSAQGREQVLPAQKPAEDAREGPPERTWVVPRASLDPGEQPGDMIDRYRLLEKLGEGGMGSVWLAEQRQPMARKVALKLIKLGMDSKEVVARFEAERQALALMNHSDIAKVFDAGTTQEGRPYFVMEWVQGIRITDYCDRHNLTTRERVGLFAQACRAVEHAHQKGIIHRDLKPPNILVSLQEGKPTVKVIDFGIAKATAGQRLTDKTIHTGLEEFMGTPAYMSPEQAEMDSLGIDARSDIFSLGVILYELLTGVTPLTRERLRELSMTEIRRVIREEDPMPPSTRLTTLEPAEQDTVARRQRCERPQLIDLVRGDLDWVVMRSLEKDRTHRYESAGALADDLERYLRNEPVLAGPPSLRRRLKKWTQRHQHGLKLAGATILSASVVTAGAILFWPRNVRERLTADQWLRRASVELENYDTAGNIAAAKRDLNEALHVYPNDARVMAELAWANWLLFDDEESAEALSDAERLAKRALDLNSNDWTANLVAGLVARNHRDFGAATNFLGAAVALSRSDALAQVILASALEAAGNVDEAEHYLGLAEESDVKRWIVLDRAGIVRMETHRPGDLDKGVADLETATVVAPDSSLAHRHLGQALLRRHKGMDLARAQSELEKALRLRRSARTLGALGSLYLAQGELETAAGFYRQAISEDPSKYIYHLSLALALRQDSGRDAEARNEFSQALDRIRDTLATGSEIPQVRAHEGLCLAALGRRQDAEEALGRAQKEGAGDGLVETIVSAARKVLSDLKTNSNEAKNPIKSNSE